jgi:hypothetical protein
MLFFPRGSTTWMLCGYVSRQPPATSHQPPATQPRLFLSLQSLKVTLYTRPHPYQPRMATTIPHIFAVLLPHSTGSAAVFDAAPTRTHPTYTVTPHRFGQRDPLPSFIIPDRPANMYMPHVSLMTPDRHNIYMGECRPSEVSIYSVYYAEPIPVFVFRDDVEWPIIGDNVLRTFAGDRDAYRFWLRRWDPDAVHDAYVMVRDGEPARAAPEPQRPQTAPLPASQPASLPAFVADALIAAAVNTAATCPITMEPINHKTAAVTSCYHVFDATALTSWFAAGNTTCPTCKQKASL